MSFEIGKLDTTATAFSEMLDSHPRRDFEEFVRRFTTQGYYHRFFMHLCNFIHMSFTSEELDFSDYTLVKSVLAQSKQGPYVAIFKAQYNKYLELAKTRHELNYQWYTVKNTNISPINQFY